MSTESLYTRLGGAAAVDAAVPLFYRKVLADDRINHFFTGMDMERLMQHQRQFLTYAFGGPNHYSGRGLAGAHRSLVTEMNLNESHFDAVVENLGATLVELGVPADLVNEAAAIAESTRAQVLNQGVA